MNEDSLYNLNYFKELRIKDLQVLLKCSERTAKRRMSLLKRRFNINSVLLIHLFIYYGVHIPSNGVFDIKKHLNRNF